MNGYWIAGLVVLIIVALAVLDQFLLSRKLRDMREQLPCYLSPDEWQEGREVRRKFNAMGIRLGYVRFYYCMAIFVREQLVEAKDDEVTLTSSGSREPERIRVRKFRLKAVLNC